LSKSVSHIDFYLVGLSNNPQPSFSAQILEQVKDMSIFSGGKRHYKIVKSILPRDHQWIEISGDMNSLMEQYQEISLPILVFVSGDPFFYGFGNTLQRLLPTANLKAYPYFNSLQLLCHKTTTNYNELKAVSVHGRSWSALDEALMENNALIGVLTDDKKTPAEIASRLLTYGFDNYTITVGESLEGEQEKIEHGSLEEFVKRNHGSLNCVLLHQTKPKPLELGLPDSEFIPLPGRANMITKLPVRLSTIHAMGLGNVKEMWDIGACTGSVSIEAKRCYPKLNVTAFEKRENCKEIIEGNKERFSAPGVEVVMGDFFEVNHNDLSLPEVAFIGGHGGRLKEMIHLLHQLNPDLKFITNAVQASTSNVFTEELTGLGYQVDTTKIKVDNHNEIAIHKAVIKEK